MPFENNERRPNTNNIDNFALNQNVRDRFGNNYFFSQEKKLTRVGSSFQARIGVATENSSGYQIYVICFKQDGTITEVTKTNEVTTWSEI